MTNPALPSGYDVVVLGGGVAGCVLAARLSEDPGRSVCLVEAGPDYGPRQQDWPRKVLNARALPRDDVWERHTAFYRIRARVLGGSSCINGAWNTWGSHADHAEWTRAGGDRWSAAALEPYRLKAVERMGLRTPPDDELSAWASAALVAARELGHQEVDMGACGLPGYGRPLINAVDGLRFNAAFAYLDPATRSRPNLTILGGALVDRLDVRAGRVHGARVVLDGERTTLTAGTYVLASGTFGSPAVLLRSGVGPAGDLKENGIHCEVELPGVGANLSDQPGVFMPLSPTAGLNAALAAKEADGKLYVSRMLVRAASEYCPDGAWDLHLLPTAGPPLFGSLPPGEYEAGISAFLMKPLSRGHVRLRSADPLEPPEIDPAFLTDPDGRDVAVLRSGLEKAQALAGAMRALAAPADGAPPHALSDAELRGRVGTYWHPVGTCAMGPAGDPRAVVDGQGAVHGVENLRIADASVLPTVPAANTQLPVLAAAEMLADALRA
ncbi:putative glucose-methanol-choline oxidoreductase [Streptomyces lucensis JCM 4490]|uniref:Glucose-methanol-choline oxidoreductase n=1 Tax=Streptomyces lucensis JCM 4490 TaxID=1306176 RepID=A0A918JA83_9ACTN|nr:GMC family oxidoreductase [Streptomyces lucensis]GGW63371.1 putative glucose-methanol-choline oxidoreductase [Streptomyces lucensis JCM 4490]